MTLLQQQKSPKSEVFRRAFIKRRLVSTGLFEDDWKEITADIKSYGQIVYKADPTRTNKLAFNPLTLRVNNDSGRYNPNTDRSSLWNGYNPIQRTLVKLEFGFVETTKINNTYYQTEFPFNVNWDNAFWDVSASVWDGQEGTINYIGIISGDLPLNDDNNISLKVMPVSQIFRDFPANNLNDFTSTGMTASRFVEMVRDHQDSNGQYVFRPFLGNTTTNWDIQTTTNNYSNINTQTAKDIIDKDVWSVIEKLAEAERFISFISSQGIFKFVSRSATADTQFKFYGKGVFDTQYGQTIKNISFYGDRIENFYSRIQVRFKEDDTSTSYIIKETAVDVANNSTSWLYGAKALEVENFYPTATAADALATTLFNDLGQIRKEIEFTTSFIPNLNILDKVEVYNDNTIFQEESLWDLNDWNTELTWYDAGGDSLDIDGEVFKLIDVNINLDRLECKFRGRAI